MACAYDAYNSEDFKEHESLITMEILYFVDNPRFKIYNKQ
jgi:hypothetical protein